MDLSFLELPCNWQRSESIVSGKQNKSAMFLIIIEWGCSAPRLSLKDAEYPLIFNPGETSSIRSLRIIQSLFLKVHPTSLFHSKSNIEKSSLFSRFYCLRSGNCHYF